MIPKIMVILVLYSGLQMVACGEKPVPQATTAARSMVDREIVKSIKETSDAASLKDQKLRNYLEPIAAKNDAMALYLLGQTYDKFETGEGTPEGAAKALDLFVRAADLNFSEAEEHLYYVYRYELMGIKEDPKKALYYLERAELHATGKSKMKLLETLYYLYLPPTAEDIATDRMNNANATASGFELNLPNPYYSEIKNTEKAVAFFRKALQIDPKKKHSWVKDAAKLHLK